MSKEKFIKAHCPHKWIMSKTEPDVLDDKWLSDLDRFENHIKEECAMIFENQISNENTDEANTNLSLNAKAIRED